MKTVFPNVGSTVCNLYALMLEHQQTSEMIRHLKTIQNSLDLLLKSFVENKVVCKSRAAHVRD